MPLAQPCPASADQEYQRLRDYAAPGLVFAPSFDADADIAAPYIATGARPRVAILREQGVTGQLEMAAAFDRAGFDAIDVHVSDLESGRGRLVAGDLYLQPWHVARCAHRADGEGSRVSD